MRTGLVSRDRFGFFIQGLEMELEDRHALREGDIRILETRNNQRKPVEYDEEHGARQHQQGERRSSDSED